MNAGLNEQQQSAVEASDGPVVIIAGPGTGKTKTLTARIAHLVSSGKAEPYEILALTFTNKAAREMQERLKGMVPKQPIVGTFHSLARRVLGEIEGELLTENVRNELLWELAKQTKPKVNPRDLGLLISKTKNQTTPPEDPAVRSALAAYDTLLAQKNLYDFDDLLLRLRDFVRRPGQRLPFRYIHVDEFQDTNELQFELLKYLNSTGNLFVIGDPLQSIYGFRGASAAIFDRFIEEWPDARHIVLQVNYRSVPEVVLTGNALFPESPALHAHRTEKGTVQAIEVLNEYGEAEWVIDQIEQQVGGSTMQGASQHNVTDKQRTFKDFAVLYRTHSAARTLQRALEANGMPYQIAGEGSPYEQPYIQTILNALRFIAGVSPAPVVGAHSASQIAKLLEPLNASSDTLTEKVERIINLLSLYSDTHATALRQFTNSLLPYEDRPLTDYLEYVQTIAEQEYYDPAADAVTLLTIHAAKGLEFPCVFLLATEEGMLPHIPKNRPSDLAEERRLFFVAATRARDELYLLHARKRAGEAKQLSSFVTGLPGVAKVIDPRLADQQRKAARRQQKRSQSSLF